MPRILTGITPSGTLHIGNYFGAMRPAIELQTGGDAYYFIADYHSMTAITDFVFGGDGNLWFVPGGTTVVRLTTSGVVTNRIRRDSCSSATVSGSRLLGRSAQITS